MVGALVLLIALQPAVPPQDIGYDCSITRGDDDEVDPRRHADLRMIRHGPSPTAQWTLVWPGRPEISATGFEAEFGSMGGSLGLRWQENGAEKTAYISFSDIRLADGSTSFWMSMDRPSLWQGAGIVCQSEPSQAGVDR